LRETAFPRRVNFRRGGERAVIEGPFAESQELIAGYWVWDVRSTDEAPGWVEEMHRAAEPR
jgi:PhnB protein